MGQLYMTARSSTKYSTKGEGVEIVKNEPFENKELGKGQYTKKIFHLSNLIPSWVRYLFSSLNHLSVVEESWNVYPNCKTVFHVKYILISIICMHKYKYCKYISVRIFWRIILYRCFDKTY